MFNLIRAAFGALTLILGDARDALVGSRATAQSGER